MTSRCEDASLVVLSGGHLTWDDMKILRVFNNNTVLAQADRGVVILTGRGLGFQTRPGEEVDPAKVVRVFEPADERETDHLASLLQGIPPEHVELVETALAQVGATRLAASPALVVALADHVTFALRRAADGTSVDYPLLAEVTHLYPDEYARARALLSALNARVPTPMPPSEAVGLALHLVNAGLATGDLSFTYTMTDVIQQVLAVVEQTFGVRLDPGSVSVGRFVTHLRFLFVRIHQHRQLDDQLTSAVGSAIRDTYAGAVECALRLGQLLELRLGTSLTDDEVSYLALHVARVTADPAA